ncbi:MAG: hypothetical protein IT196_11320 [Acidimicrobiales bacterium]|nr:hypothetical protein [Acidimicrobiales bacterium]
MKSRRFAVIALIAGPVCAATMLASTAGAMTPTRAGSSTPPPVTTLSCKELHSTIGKLNSWLDDHASYNNSGDASKQQDYNDHFDMMASMQIQGRKAGCYTSAGMPTT